MAESLRISDVPRADDEDLEQSDVFMVPHLTRLELGSLQYGDDEFPETLRSGVKS
jgi:hypothetical protein